MGEKGLAALTALQDPPMADVVGHLDNLGSHSLRMRANVI